MNHIPDATKINHSEVVAMARAAGFVLFDNYADSMKNSIEHLANAAHAAGALAERERLLAVVEMPEMPRAFFCTKCGSFACKGDIKEKHPQCANCGYLGFAKDKGYTADQLRETVASAVARKDANIASLTLEVAHKAEYAATTSRAHESVCHERDALKAEVERLKTAVANKREACAKLYEELAENAKDAMALRLQQIADVIRAGGTHENSD